MVNREIWFYNLLWDKNKNWNENKLLPKRKIFLNPVNKVMGPDMDAGGRQGRSQRLFQINGRDQMQVALLTLYIY